MTITTSRRGFLGGAAAAALVVGVRPDGVFAAGQDGTMFNPFVRITSDGRVTAIVKHFEMGQGPATGLTTLIAEELGVTMDQIDYEFAPSDATKYNNLFFGPMQGTGGSTAMANSFTQYREAGAVARDMLIAAAANEWGVGEDELTLEDGLISGVGRSASLGEFVAVAAQGQTPVGTFLKDPSEFRLIGNPNVRRKDTGPKITGAAKFAMDVQLPGQMVVVIARPPRLGGTVAGMDDSAAREVKGFLRSAVLPGKAGVAVYADGTWAAFQARDALRIDWDFSAAEGRDSDRIRQELIAAIGADADYDVEGDRVEVAARINSAARIVEKTFYLPMLAHAPMEPLTCTIEPDGTGGVILHDGCQSQTGAHFALASVLQLPPGKIQINTMFAGGSFGRRANPTSDYQVEAAMAFAMTDRSRPVKLVWSREDDITGGYYRPAVAHRVRVGLDGAGDIVGWDHRVAAQSIMKGTPFEAFAVQDGVDGSSVEGVTENPYRIPGHYIGLTDVEKATSTLWWRSVGHSHTAFVMESMMDIAAEAAGRNPVEFRLKLLEGGDRDQARLAGVLKLAADRSGFGNAPAGHAQGIAVHKSFNSYVAQVAEISGNAVDGVRIERVTCAVDCGIAVNPDIVKAQMESGIGYGIGHTIRNEITLTEGAVDQSNFPDYEPLRMRDIAVIDVHVVKSTQPPTGVGEPGTPPAAPALANAVAAAGHRVTQLPMANHGVAFV